jgi:hypothetical protein
MRSTADNRSTRDGLMAKATAEFSAAAEDHIQELTQLASEVCKL